MDDDVECVSLYLFKAVLPQLVSGAWLSRIHARSPCSESAVSLFAVAGWKAWGCCSGADASLRPGNHQGSGFSLWTQSLLAVCATLGTLLKYKIKCREHLPLGVGMRTEGTDENPVLFSRCSVTFLSTALTTKEEDGFSRSQT